MTEANLHRQLYDAMPWQKQQELEMNAVTTMEWRLCKFYPDYEISEHGDLRRKQGAVRRSGLRVRGCIDADGYIDYMITDSVGDRHHEKAHVLVAETFISPRPSILHEVAHNNGSKLNCHYSNLRWTTRQQNSDDRPHHGTDPKGTANGRATITDDDVRYIRKRYREIKLERGDVAELDKKFRLHRSQIIRIARYIAWSHVPDCVHLTKQVDATRTA